MASGSAESGRGGEEAGGREETTNYRSDAELSIVDSDQDDAMNMEEDGAPTAPLPVLTEASLLNALHELLYNVDLQAISLKFVKTKVSSYCAPS